MPRCTSTNLFASYDEPEAEIESESAADGTVEFEVRVIRPCAECGEEMAEYSFTPSAEYECPRCGNECGGHYGTERDLPEGTLPSDKLPEDDDDYDPRTPEVDVDSSDVEVSESGGGRYKKNIFTVSVNATLLCNCCGGTFEVDATDEAAASSFEVLV